MSGKADLERRIESLCAPLPLARDCAAAEYVIGLAGIGASGHRRKGRFSWQVSLGSFRCSTHELAVHFEQGDKTVFAGSSLPYL